MKIYSKWLSFHICPPKRRSLATWKTSAPSLLWILSKVKTTKKWNDYLQRITVSWLSFHAISRASFSRWILASINHQKKFISNKFNAWYADRVSKQFPNAVARGNVKVSLKSSYLKPLLARWIVETYYHLKHKNDSIIKGFDAAGISEDVTCANDVFTRVAKTLSMNRDNNRIFSSFFAFYFHHSITLFDLWNQLNFLFFCQIYLSLSLFWLQVRL